MPSYSPRIVDHFTNPRNVGEMDDAHVKAFVGNPVCGDQIHLYAKVDGERILEASFLAYGCAASLATASILSEEIRGKILSEIEAFDEDKVTELVGGLSPEQRHCATLGVDVLRSLVSGVRGGSPEGTVTGSPVCH